MKLKRFLAYTIDSLIYGFLVLGLLRIFPLGDSAQSALMFASANFFLGFIYFVLIPFTKGGQTFGKMINGIKVSSMFGDAGLDQLFKRELLKSLLPFLASVFLAFTASTGIGVSLGGTVASVLLTASNIITWSICFAVLLHPGGMGLHDRLGGTIVTEK